jgi:hypothetical protein
MSNETEEILKEATQQQAELLKQLTRIADSLEFMCGALDEFQRVRIQK